MGLSKCHGCNCIQGYTGDVMNHCKVQWFLWYFQMKLEVYCLQFVCGPLHSVEQCVDPITIIKKMRL